MDTLAAVTICWALVATGTVAFAALRMPRRRARSSSPPRVLLVRPADSLHDRERLAVGHRISAPGVRAVIASPEDPGVVGATWLWSNPECTNRKVGHLLAAARLLMPEEVLVCADADVLADDALVHDLAGAINDGAGLAVAVPRTSGGKGAAAVALSGVLDSSLMSFAAQAAFSGTRAICGKAIAFSPALLAKLPETANVLAEDMALVEMAQAARMEVVTVRSDARIIAAREDDWRAVVARMKRWLVAAKAQRPLAYYGLPFFIAPAPLLLVLSFTSVHAAAAVAVAFLARTWLAARLVRHRLLPRPSSWIAGEAVLLVAWLFALPARTIAWRGRTLAIGKGGYISQSRVAP